MIKVVMKNVKYIALIVFSGIIKIDENVWQGV